MNIVIFKKGEHYGSTRYITSMGELTRKDNSLCFRKGNKNIYIPVENTREIYCMNEVSLNTVIRFPIRNNIIYISLTIRGI